MNSWYGRFIENAQRLGKTDRCGTFRIPRLGTERKEERRCVCHAERGGEEEMPWLRERVQNREHGRYVGAREVLPKRTA